jgi:hypothetical protein
MTEFTGRREWMRILYLQESRILSSFIKSDLESNLGVLYATAQVGRRDD